MSWVRLDDRFTENPKVAALSDSEFRTWVATLCYCARQKDPTVDTATTNAVPGLTPARVRKYAAQGLLDKHGKAHVIHDWLKYAPKDQTAADRMAKWRARRSVTVTSTVTPTVTEGPETMPETVTPPVTAPSREPVSRSSSHSLSPTNVGEPHAHSDELRVLIGKVGGDSTDLERAQADPARAIAVARFTLAQKDVRKPLAYYRKLWTSGDHPEPAGPTFLPLLTLLEHWMRNVGYLHSWPDVEVEVGLREADRREKISSDDMERLRSLWLERQQAVTA